MASPYVPVVSCAAVDPVIADVLAAFDILGLSAVAAVPSADVSNVSGVPAIAVIPALVGVPGFAGVPAVVSVPALAVLYGTIQKNQT